MSENKTAEQLRTDYPDGWDVMPHLSDSCKHFMWTDPMRSRILRAFPEKDLDFCDTVYGNTCRLIECLIHFTPTWLLRAYFEQGFSPNNSTIDRTIEFLKADVKRRRSERFRQGAELLPNLQKS